jgi:hypothetical protein
MRQWSIFKDYINSIKIGELVTRKDINKVVYKNPEVWREYSQTTTVDVYRLSLTHIGILSYIKRGVYRVNYHIKKEVTSKQVHALAYNRVPNWRDWFIPELENRIGHIIDKE